MSGDNIFKAFRPSRFASRDPMDEQSQHDKEVKMAQYQLRAKAGLPLFDSAAASISPMHKKTR